MIWRTSLSVIGVVACIIVLAMLPLNMRAASAVPLLQVPTSTDTLVPTNTSIPTDTPIPTNTPISTDTPVPPTGTSIVPTPSAGTSTPIPPVNTPRPGGGGGVPPGPSGTPMVNGCVKSVGKNGISLSTAPGFYQPHMQIIPRGRLAQVLAGPERADSIWWWRLRTDAGVEGWGNQDEMTPDPGPCAFGGGVSPTGPVPPYPVTILPSLSLAPQATPVAQETLPQTGNGSEWWFLAGILAIIVIVVGFVRRRLQTQPAGDGRSLQDDETDVGKQ